ncbi:MAG: NAD(+) synthase [Ignavibacteriales bacterium]
MDMDRLAGFLSDWISAKVREAGAAGAVVGVSGGIDSAVVLALCRRALGDNVLGLILPCHSLAEDIDHAELVLRHFRARGKTIRLDRVYDDLVAAGGEAAVPGDSRAAGLARANVKPRLRMTALYYHANMLNYLVAGTGNRSEIAVGYFTKYGDGGVDILPIGGLVKEQVRALAAHLGVPRVVIDKPPTAGLWPGQTDEGEMGITYRDIDDYLLTGKGDRDVIRRIGEMHARSEHKRRPAPVAALPLD